MEAVGADEPLGTAPPSAPASASASSSYISPVYLDSDPKRVKWKASKKQIMQYWQTLRSDQLILMRPIPSGHTGSTYGEDGIRITGSPQFIGSVLSKLKDLMAYENPQTKLGLVYRQSNSPSHTSINAVKTSYAFYLQARERNFGQKKLKFKS
jgi:hypothetical protein